MMYYTHLSLGILASLLLVEYPIHKMLFISILLFFSVFPDIDETNSKIGRNNKIVSSLLNLIFGHRKLLHTFFIPILLFAVFYNLSNEIATAILLGYSCHLFADSLTRKGIKPLYPLINKRVYGPFRTNSMLEKIIFLAIMSLNIYLASSYVFGIFGK